MTFAAEWRKTFVLRRHNMPSSMSSAPYSTSHAHILDGEGASRKKSTFGEGTVLTIPSKEGYRMLANDAARQLDQHQLLPFFRFPVTVVDNDDLRVPAKEQAKQECESRIFPRLSNSLWLLEHVTFYLLHK